MSELRNVPPAGHVEGSFRGRHREIVVLSFSVLYAGVAMMTRFRALEALFLKIIKESVGKIMREIVGKIVREIVGRIVRYLR
jgi:hypothetical protein